MQQNEGWKSKKIKYKGFGRIILRIYKIQILKSRLQSTCVASMVFREVATLEIRRTEIEVRVGKLKIGKVVGKDEITGEMIKGRGDMVVD